MNKFILYVFLFCLPFTATAKPAVQDSIAVTQTASFPATDTVSYRQLNFEKDFQDKYTDTDFVYETKLKESTAWDRFLEWLFRLLRDLFSFSDKAQSASTIIVRIIALAVILFVVYIIVKNILGKDGFWIFGRAKKNITVEDLTEADINQMDFRQLINTKKNEGDYRLAIRYYYLWLLKTLANKEIIAWHPDKTNSDYLYEIKNNTLRKEFEYLSYVYDYSWYGEFPVDENNYAKAEKAFLKTLSNI